MLLGSFAYAEVVGNDWNFSNPKVCESQSGVPQCEASAVDLTSTPSLRLVNGTGGAVPFAGAATSYGIPLAACQTPYLSYPEVHSGTAVVGVCFDAALLTTQDAAGTVDITVKIPLPTLVSGQDCGRIRAQLLSLNGSSPEKVSEYVPPTFVQSISDGTLCSATFAVDASVISELITSSVSKTSFAVVLQEPTTILCVAAPVGVGIVTLCRATVNGNSPTGTVTWTSAGKGAFTPPACNLSRLGYCQVTYRPASGLSPMPVTARYSGDAHNSQSAGVFPLTVNVKPSRTSVTCTPSSLKAGSSSHFTCTAIVNGFNPTGTVVWKQTGFGTVSFAQSSCNLVAKKCNVVVSPLTQGLVTISAVYQGDPNNGLSTGSRNVIVK